MTRPNEEADRLWMQASQLRLIAKETEARAAALRPSRTPYDHHRYFQLLWERDYGGLSRELTEAYGYPLSLALCHYCDRQLHPFDRSHVAGDRGCGGVADEWCANIEHRTPVARGGTNELGNLTLSCRRCNHRKGTMTEAEFRVLLRLDDLGSPIADPDFPNPGHLANEAIWDLTLLAVEAMPQYADQIQQWAVERTCLINAQERDLIEVVCDQMKSAPAFDPDFDPDFEPF